MYQIYWTILWYYVIVCAVTFLSFGIDKFKAKKGLWRIPEKTLLTLCLVGGAWGGMAGMKTFHHKTLKPVFAMGVPAMAVLHVAVLGGLCYLLQTQ